jgi:hypothetical protein
MIKAKLIVLAIALVLSAVLMARAVGTTSAYFSDTKTGALSGTLGQCSSLWTLEPGASKARHGSDSRCSRLLPIARLDSEGSLFLDFGDEVPGNSNSSPDVFRIVSHASVDAAVSFAIDGDIAPLIDAVELSGHTAVLRAGRTTSVRVKLRVPRGAHAGEYRGDLVLSVNGVEALRVPMTLNVQHRGRGGAFRVVPLDEAPRPQPHVAPSPSANVTPSAEPGSPSPSPSATVVAPTPKPTATPTPQASPSGTIIAPSEPPAS